MGITVLIPTALQSYASGQESLSADGSTVKEILVSITTKYPDLKKHLFNEKGALRSFVNIYLNDEDIRYQNNQGTKIKDGDTITIVPSIAGGIDLSQEELRRYSRHLIMPEKLRNKNG